MVWPWEQFNWGVFWAIIAATIVLAVLYFLILLIFSLSTRL